MMTNDRKRLTAVLALAVLASASLIPFDRASAQPKQAAPQFTPAPTYTLPPASVPTSLPYPAYGTPVPGVGAGTPAPGVPDRVNLPQAIAVGFARSPVLAAARADVGVAAAGVRLQRAGLLPTIDGSANVGRSYDQSGSLTINTGGGLSANHALYENLNSVTASLRQLIFDGGRVAAEIRSAQRNETALADTYRRALQTAAFNVADAYYTYLEAQRTTAVDVELVRTAQVQEQLVEAQFRAGTAARADVVTAQLPVAQAKLAVVRAQGAEFAAQAAFANVMGLDAGAMVQPIDDTPLAIDAPISSLPVPTYTQALARALALRPDYDSSVQTIASAQQALRAAKLGLFPNLAGTAQAGTDSSNSQGGAYRNASQVGLALSIPLYDGGITAANTAQAQANVDIAVAGLQNTKLGIQLNVKQALTNLVSSEAALDQARAELQNAIEVLQATQAQYKAGVTTLPLLLNAQTGLTQAVTDRVTTIYNLRIAEQQYLYAVGQIGS
jgi:outer membrane protein